MAHHLPLLQHAPDLVDDNAEGLSHGGFSYFTAVCFTINFIMGCGFLGIPAAFQASGFLLGPIIVLVLTLLCNFTKDFLLEALARLEAFTRVTEDTKCAPGEVGRRLRPRDFIITQRKFEIADAVERLLGPGFKRVYTALLSVFLYGALWAYSSVFAASLAANIPTSFNDYKVCTVGEAGCDKPYHLFLFVFACIVIPLTCVDFEEQVSVQVLMSVARVVVVFLMSFTVLGAAGCDGMAFEPATAKDPVIHGFSSQDAFKWAGLSTLVPTAVYASIFHHSIPVLSQSVKDKSRLRSIFAVAFGVTTGFYVVIGMVISLYFGDQVNSQCNLNWKDYVGCSKIENGHRVGSVPWWAHLIRIVVLIFPALDVMSAFPLNAVTLGNNLMVSFTGHGSHALVPGESWWNLLCTSRWRQHFCKDKAAYASVGDMEQHGAAPAQDPAEVATRRKYFRIKVLFRFLAACPPLVGAAFVHDLGHILDYSGLVAIIIAFVVPCALRQITTVRCKEALAAADDAGLTAGRTPVGKAGEESASDEKMLRTAYHSPWSLDWVVYTTVAIGLALFFYVFIENVKQET